ncbi:MAG: D-glycero-beta-D-manno-heptose 1-phosphate adenylyltransferase, partial [Campylobacter concisus]|nr:D-glycero-beta-D-manno-heptose 1-phosphate adenylyltransferase [Campylobacter concisus]
AKAKEVFDVTGAGDTVLATLGYMLATGADIKEAIKMANLAAAVVVAKIGSATASFSEIEQLLNSSFGANFEHKLKSVEELEEILSQKGKKKVVFTNGCFDILHAGHVKYLARARELGDLLVVGLNSDASVKRLKGETRPINSQDDRACVLSGLGFVDYVVIFDEDTPLNLITKIKPDVLVKGADYKGKEVVGSEIVKEVRLIDFVEGKTTLPYIYLYKSLDEAGRAKLRSLWAKKLNADEISWLKENFDKTSSLSKAISEAKRLGAEAIEAIKEYKNAEFEGIIKSMIDREF